MDPFKEQQQFRYLLKPKRCIVSEKSPFAQIETNYFSYRTHQSSEQLLTMISLRSAFDIVFDEMKKL